VRVVDHVGSTNEDLASAIRSGTASEGTVLIAEQQLAGKGRRGRSWIAPYGSALTFSMTLHPEGVEPARLGLLPLLAGVALAVTINRQAGLAAKLKWPNDLQVENRKLAGILVERVGGFAVVGVGLNVSQTAEELPTSGATSLTLEGASVDRASLLVSYLREMETHFAAWRAAGGDAERSGLAAAYRRLCVTFGRDVLIDLPSGEQLAGRATGIDQAGRLTVATPASEEVVSAGDVVHVR
jgi:BirA family transcriptional regulator, biotin operon repressor / biotin---[acetyl-CoA-carboxylase] ligase